MTEQHFTEQTKVLIDSLKTICAHYGLGNDGNEFKIISQAFLYKFLNDKYDFEVKKVRKENPNDPIEFVNMDIEGKTAVLKPEHSIKYLSERQNGADFAKLFDDTLTDIAACNAELFSVKTEGGAKIVSQKSSNLLRLNLILNNLVHSLNNVVQGNTILSPAHKDASGCLKKFDFIVSNPPFKLDFSDFRDRLESDENHERFFAGIPKIKPTKKEKMEIYQLFIQHILFSLKENGKVAIVLPTGFITAKSGIDKKIREYLVENKMLAGVVSMPSNIFATTGTNVSILFIDKVNKDKVVLIDASGLGEKISINDNQKTVLSHEEEQKICHTFTHKQAVEDFSVVVGYDEIKAKNYSLSAGQYFEVKIDYVDISAEEFEQKMAEFSADLDKLFAESAELEKEIKDRLAMLKFNS
ncbi:type I restriction-modification system subunit M [Neisseria meningitidis]|nr:type I restriction-modification system subunit M [Neisseria meningitidis]